MTTIDVNQFVSSCNSCNTNIHHPVDSWWQTTDGKLFCQPECARQTYALEIETMYGSSHRSWKRRVMVLHVNRSGKARSWMTLAGRERVRQELPSLTFDDAIARRKAEGLHDEP